MYPKQAPVTVRPAVAGDVAAIQALFGEIDRHHARLLPGDIKATPSARPSKEILRSIRAPNGLFLVCERDGEIAGFLRATLEEPPAPPFAKPYRCLKVHDMAVAKRMRSEGIGSALMARAEEWARSKQARRVQLNVFAKNHEAVTFYDELGYECLSARLEKRL